VIADPRFDAGRFAIGVQILIQAMTTGEIALPMAQELGLGVLPWSPLKMWALSGKYTRANGQKMQGYRGTFVGELTDKRYDIVDTPPVGSDVSFKLSRSPNAFRIVPLSLGTMAGLA
jgi:hypothetical protein